MASASGVDAGAGGAGASRLPAPHSGHTGVYRLAKVDGHKAAGISGLLFLRADRGCVLRLVLATGDDRRRVRLLRGVWWPVPSGIRTLTSDGCVAEWPVSPSAVTVRFPLAAPGAVQNQGATDVKFVRVR